MHRHETGLRVLDLDSTSGVRVNDEKVTPKTWVELHHGDNLRCGKIVFEVNLIAVDPSQQQEGLAAAAASMVRGEAWQEADIAEYLESEDAADQERRYEAIRSTTASTAHKDSNTDQTLDVDENVYTEPVDEEDEPAADDKDKVSEKEAKSKKKGKSAKAKGSRRFSRLPKKKRRKMSSSGGGVLSAFGDPERLKMVGAILLLVGVLGVLGYSFHRFYNGPTVRVLEGID